MNHSEDPKRVNAIEFVPADRALLRQIEIGIAANRLAGLVETRRQASDNTHRTEAKRAA